MIRIRDIDHLVLRVVDVEAMLKFYVDALGFDVMEPRREGAFLSFRGLKNANTPDPGVVLAFRGRS